MSIQWFDFLQKWHVERCEIWVNLHCLYQSSLERGSTKSQEVKCYIFCCLACATRQPLLQPSGKKQMSGVKQLYTQFFPAVRFPFFPCHHTLPGAWAHHCCKSPWMPPALGLFYGVRLFQGLVPKLFIEFCPQRGPCMVIQHVVMQGLKMNCLKTQSTCQTWHCSAFILAVFTMQSPVHLYFQQSEFNNDSAWRNPQLPSASREDLSLVVIPFSRLTNATPQDKPVWMQVLMHYPLNLILRFNFKILQTNPCHPPCGLLRFTCKPLNLYCKFALQAKWINIWE